jgi:beta-lactamase superfamily II metal-dependent hydrolase
MFFSLDVLRARKGDCLMLHYGSQDAPRLMLIDGGPSNVYRPHLKPRLAQVHASRGLEEGEALPVDVVMVSHVDDDHIRGIVELTEEQRLAAPGLRVEARSLWHNSFDDLLTTRPEELMAGFGVASVLAGVDHPAAFDGLDLEAEAQHQTVEVLASIAQGRTLRDNATQLGWRPNREFKGKLILATGPAKSVMLDDVKVTVAGPMQPELLALQQMHDKFLSEQKKGDKKTPEAMLAAFVDAAVPNLSSIVVLAELDKKSMLLTGDARGDKILEGMELAGLLTKGGKRSVNILKVPHHGSDNNMETIFFERLPADHYVFSGNGEHGNPERKTLEMLLEARPDGDYTIHLTYPVEEIDVGRKADWEKEQGKQKKRQKKNPAKEVREDWSPEKHGLTAFFKDNPEFARKVKIVDEKKPHMIDLLDAVKL